jgi:hypothetical protein
VWAVGNLCLKSIGKYLNEKDELNDYKNTIIDGERELAVRVHQSGTI